MEESFHADLPDGRRPKDTRWWDVVHHVAVPATGGAALVLGSALATGVRVPVGAYVPAVLLATGAATLGATVARHFLRSRKELVPSASREPPTADPKADAGRSPCAHCAGTG